MHSLEIIQDWYMKNCNNDWEHQYGIKIETIDNPGWGIQIDIINTNLENISINPVEIDRSELDWMHYKISDKTIYGACGPKNLLELLEAISNIIKTN